MKKILSYIIMGILGVTFLLLALMMNLIRLRQLWMRVHSLMRRKQEL